MKSWFRSLSLIKKVATVSTILIMSIGAIGVAAQQQNNTATLPVNVQAKSAPKVETKTVSTTENIPYTSSTVNDSSLLSGTTQVQTKGANGVLTHTYEVTYTDNVETNRSKSVDTITEPAVNEVILNGTMVCSNGTYINAAGNTVCSPYSASSAPSGATAKCSDGTYSFSQSRRGTCSHHGGVEIWL